MKTLPRPEINSMVIKTTQKISYNSLVAFLNLWAPKALRIKGFVNLTDNSVYAVQCVYNEIHLQRVEALFHPTELAALSVSFTLREWHNAFRELSVK
jgi:G3E family GTPase